MASSVPADRGSGAAPPSIEPRVTERIVHGETLRDSYAWLRAANWREVLRDPAALPAEIRAVLDAENAYADRVLDGLSLLTAELLGEMRGRMEEADSSVPLRYGPWLYYTRHVAGGQQPAFCRRRAGAGAEPDGEEEVLVDGEVERAGHAYFRFGAIMPSPDHRRLAWAVDTAGSEYFEIHVRDLADGQNAVRASDTDGSLVWLTDGSGFYYVHVDESHRTGKVYRHRFGAAGDELVFAEDDPAWFVDIARTATARYGVITVSDHESTECHLLDLDDPRAAPVCVEPRSSALRYSVVHRGDALFIRTNADGAEDFKVVTAPVATPGRAHWLDVVPHRRGCVVSAIAAFPDHLVRLEREDGLPRLVLRDLRGNGEQAIAFPEDAYALGLSSGYEFDTTVLRFTYQSPTTPTETWDYDLASGERALRKRQRIPSGHDPAGYVARRLQATAPDGASVPVTLLHRAGLALDGTAPLLLYGYGAYGHALGAGFSANILSLVDRGVVYAIAHVRGGADKGWHWYTDGKLARKVNSFGDFIAAARHLVGAGYTATGRIVAQGGSAGGLLVGAVANMAPELFAGVVAAVPFVDVLNTMLDGELPLTPPEWLEWGNPIADVDAFRAIRAYSPYDNVSAQHYPPMLVLAGLTDPRVTYWEPAKWVARLRATMAGGGPVLLKTNMGAGHGGASGRFGRLAEIAEQYAFTLACVGQAAGYPSMKDFSSAIDAKR